jgi:hypothetical protein
VIIGLRSSPGKLISFGGGYVATLKRIDEDPARGVYPGPIHGFIMHFGLAFKRE